MHRSVPPELQHWRGAEGTSKPEVCSQARWRDPVILRAFGSGDRVFTGAAASEVALDWVLQPVPLCIAGRGRGHCWFIVVCLGAHGLCGTQGFGITAAEGEFTFEALAGPCTGHFNRNGSVSQSG